MTYHQYRGVSVAGEKEHFLATESLPLMAVVVYNNFHWGAIQLIKGQY